MNRKELMSKVMKLAHMINKAYKYKTFSAALKAAWTNVKNSKVAKSICTKKSVSGGEIEIIEADFTLISTGNATFSWVIDNGNAADLQKMADHVLPAYFGDKGFISGDKCHGFGVRIVGQITMMTVYLTEQHALNAIKNTTI